ncbi:GSCOCG00011336001-RA-CDS [Cotesia congregata]|nr:GSCOCG00011336001-RA-CDS [Cotesia congregata]
MSDRVKKYRALKKYMDNRSQPPNTPSLLIDNDHNTNDHDHNNLSSETIVNSVVNKENNYGAFVSDNESSLSDCVDDSYQSIYPAESEVIISNETDTDSSDSNNQSIAEENVVNPDTIREKLRQWSLKNLNSLQLNVISELLVILREEGHPTLPKTAQALLQTKHHQVVETITSLKETDCDYKYLGVANGLKKMISSRVFLENTIEVLIHIDGMQIYKNSNIQVWPITVKIFNRNYTSHPFVAAIYCGDSKPANVKEYLSDFVVECKNLINNGIVIDEKNYSFKIIAIVADSQARSYIKCCKAAGTFYACERCTIEGKSVGEKKRKKRVYPEMDCELRTRESFKKQTQKSHHKDGLKSLLRKLPNFDPVNSVILDSMHLLHLGVIKTLMDACGYSEQVLRDSK